MVDPDSVSSQSQDGLHGVGTVYTNHILVEEYSEGLEDDQESMGG